LRGEAGRCPGCGGIEATGEALSSIAGEELVTLIFEQGSDAPLGDLSCPWCVQPMHVIGAKRVEIDVCTDDGILWLDGGELARFRPGLNDQNLADPRSSAPASRATLFAAALMDLFD
jgi:hypothetical protein